MNFTVMFSVGSFLFILSLIIFLRSKNSRFEIKPADIVVSVLPLFVFLLATGKLQKFEIGEGGVKIETAFVDASASAITPQITLIKGLSAEPVRIGAKGAESEIPKLIADKSEALLLQLGYANYTGRAIAQYLGDLSQTSVFKYVIFVNSDQSFFGLVPAKDLLMQLRSVKFSPDMLAQYLEQNNADALKKISGLMTQASSLNVNVDKGDALKKMEEMNIDTLPVVDEKKIFVGVVSRSRLTASLLLDVTSTLKK